jgi:hypothetical protein
MKETMNTKRFVLDEYCKYFAPPSNRSPLEMKFLPSSQHSAHLLLFGRGKSVQNYVGTFGKTKQGPSFFQRHQSGFQPFILWRSVGLPSVKAQALGG